MNKAAKAAESVSVKYHLHRLLSGWQKERSNRVVHASDLMKKDGEFCPRERVLHGLTKAKRKDRFINTSLNMVFKVSSSAANVIVDTLADAGMAVMDWHCGTCGFEHELRKRPVECDVCKGQRFYWTEPVFVSEYSGVSGSVDLLVDLGGPKLKLVEIKGFEAEEFKKFVAPYAEHRWRTNLYMRLVDESNARGKNRVDTETALVLYVVKGGFGPQDSSAQDWGLMDGMWSPFKEYVVKRDDSSTHTLVESARSVMLARRKEGPMPKGVCANKLDKRASKCQVAPVCFGKKYLAGKVLK